MYYRSVFKGVTYRSLGRGVGIDGLRVSVVSSGPSLTPNENQTRVTYMVCHALICSGLVCD